LISKKYIWLKKKKKKLREGQNSKQDIWQLWEFPSLSFIINLVRKKNIRMETQISMSISHWKG
jgi:hypothetical protein